uniref:Haemolymph juvenile hormone binding protein n=1 Tax=Glossina pallidipes TaxID=7398 RepID=A0A1B0A9P2_GLOPL
MQLLMLQLLAIAIKIGSSTTAISTAINSQESTTIDDLLAFPDQSIKFKDDPQVEYSANKFQIIPCSLSDAGKNECIRGLFNQVLPKLKGGLSDYGMPSMDPYFYNRGIFRYSSDGIQGGLLIKNVNIRGISNIFVKTFIGNFTNDALRVKLGLELKQLTANGEFKADVKFGGLRLVPKGPFNITLNNVRATILTDGHLINKDSSLRVQLRRLNANVAVGNARINANGIFSDNNLNNMILNLVNENLLEIIRIGIPATREQWSPILVEHINKFFSQVPSEKFLVQ